MNENRRILIVDDDLGVLESYQAILHPSLANEISLEGARLFGGSPGKATGIGATRFDLTFCDRGEAGVRALKEALSVGSPFAAAFVDISMPGIDGIETARRIWAVDARLKIVIVTAFSTFTPDDIIGVTHREDLLFLRKPFHSEEIRQLARAMCRQWNLERAKESLSAELQNAHRQLEQNNLELRRKVEEQTRLLIQSEKMVALGVLAAGVAHEINNPISFVDSNLSTLKKYCCSLAELLSRYGEVEACLEAGDAARAKELMDGVKGLRRARKIDYIIKDMVDLAEESLDGTRRVRKIVSDLKSFSRNDRDEMTHTDINATLDAAINIVWNEIKHKAELIRDYGDLPLVQCLPQRLGQVFLNLLVNAAQAIVKEGTVRVVSRFRSRMGDSGSGWVEVSITDDGSGIPAEDLPRIFDPFYTTKPVGQGTGLGLSIAYDIVTAHGGTLRVESRENVGTTFVIALPCEPSTTTRLSAGLRARPLQPESPCQSP